MSIDDFDITAAENELDSVRSRYLRERGWELTSATPHHCWMWQKPWGSRVLLVTEETALAIERASTGDSR